ncbi:MAG: Ig-like domain-containing protein, partial [Roseburia sp.]|nr:Ig-like domain-containing protein [Roseburia sp.]
VGTSCKVSARKKGTATITATAMDGSGKKAKMKLKVTPFVSDKTSAPTAEPDPYIGTDVQNFESYEVGTDWTTLAEGGATKGEAYANSNVGTMKVVQDPENAENKCLEIDYTYGDTQAYDFAPVFTVDLSKLAECDASTKLSKFVGVRFNCRVVANTPDCQYKTIACYFAPAGSITPQYYFDTSLAESGEYFKFKADASMATGEDKDYAAKLYNDLETTENQKVFPAFFTKWSEGKYGEKSCSPGYKENEADATVGFAKRTILFNTERMKTSADGNMLDSTTFDMVFGSTYKGMYAPYGYHMKIYIDDVQLVTADIPITGIDIKKKPEQMVVDSTTKLEPVFTPENTTHQEVVWTSSDRNIATVDKEGNVYAESAGTVVITVTSKDNPAISQSLTITVKEPDYADAPLKIDLTDLSKYITLMDREDPTKEATLKPTVNDDGSITIPYTGASQYAIYDFGQDVDMTQYQSFSITGYSAGQFAIELYSAETNLTFRKSLGDAYDWWEEAQWNYYPFFEGSASERMSNGHFVTKGEETVNVVWQYGGGKMDLSKIRYMVIKSNNAPMHPASFEDPECKYTIKDITFSPDYAYHFEDGRVHTTSLNEAVATSSVKRAQLGIKKEEFTKKVEAQASRKGDYRDVTKFNGDDSDGISFTSKAVANDVSGMAFYLDFVNCSTENRVISQRVGDDEKVYDLKIRHKKIDLTQYDYQYIKVDVTVDSDISVKMLNDGSDWASGITVAGKAAYKGSDGCYYFPIADFAGIDLTAVDAVGVAFNTAGVTGTINKIQFVKDKP